MTRAKSPVGSRKQRCETCGEPAVASELRQGMKTPLCAVHLALSDPEAAELYAKILQIEGHGKH